MDYKDSLLMPNTEFSMRGNLPENEKIQREKWESMNLYEQIVEKNKDGIPFVLHDGPPYANGDIHMGHSLNKIIKDFINRNKMMEGFNATYIPGWDTHGLPIESAVTKTGVNRKEMSKVEFRKLCESYAKEQVARQMEGFKSLNTVADYKHPYITYNKEMEARQIEVFAEMTKKGLIFKGLKPVYWSPSSESALAEAEIEYKEKKDPSVFVAFPVVKGNDLINVSDQLIIWTTTPWTLPGNLAIAVGDFDYSKVEFNNNTYIVATDLVESLMKEFEVEDYKIIKTFKGSQLENIEYRHVFMNRDSKVVLGDHVTLDAGTGLVHIAPSYGVDDFNVGRKHNLGMVNGVDDQGVLTEESGPFAGLFYEDANKEITQKLDELNALIKLKFIKHSYPHDWRTKKPVIYRATAQWFCSIDKIREKLLYELDNSVHFHTAWGKTRLYNMIRDRGDWCISRQRVWGVPIPIFYNEDGSEILDYDVMMHVSNLFRQHGSNIWFEKDAKDLLPEGYTNPLSPNGNFKKEEDIMDVWFDSGSTHTGVLVERNMPYPADIYFEGSDQYRGWFNSSLICGVAAHDKAPYKTLISHGFMLDGKGIKMSKSVGNVIDPAKLIRLHGADVLRLWVSSVDYTEDVRISDESINQVKESYRKIRNTYRFMLGNLSDYDNNTDRVDYTQMNYFNKYMMIRLNEVIKSIKNSYSNYNFQEIYKTVNNFIATELSNFYLDFTKDILYIEGAKSHIRRSVQTVLYDTLTSLIKLLAPILPYTSEEVYKLLKNKDQESIHLTNNPEVVEYSDSEEIKQLFEKFFAIKNDVYKALEEARNEKVIGKSLEAKVYINVSEEYNCVFEKLDLKQLLIVSEIVKTEDTLNNYEVSQVKVEAFVGAKCERCWNYFKEEEMVEDICKRCNDVVKG